MDDIPNDLEHNHICFFLDDEWFYNTYPCDKIKGLPRDFYEETDIDKYT